jgi:hypothetical protein
MKRLTPTAVALLALLLAVSAVSAVTYWSGTQGIKQVVKEVASGAITTATIELPAIDEGASATYTTADVPAFDKALTVTVAPGKAPRTLTVTFQNPDAVGAVYTAYTFKLIADTVPEGSTLSGTVATVSLTSTTATVTLDEEGTYKFDYEVSVTAGQVTEDTTVTATIAFSLE